MPKVAWISIAPVKSLGLVQRDSVVVEPFGVRENRRFYLLDERGRMVNGKRVGPLVGVLPEYDDAAGSLALAFPDGGRVEAEVRPGESVTADFYGRAVPGRVVEGPFAEALSGLAGEPLRLVLTDEPGAGVDRGRGQISLVTTAALDALAGAAACDGPVDGRRFRMLFGVEGAEAHAEDGWLGRRVRVGEAVVRPRGNVGRCAVTTQNPDTGVPDLDTLKAIKAYRGELPSSEPLPFGVWGDVVEPGRVAVGDVVEPLDS